MKTPIRALAALLATAVPGAAAPAAAGPDITAQCGIERLANSGLLSRSLNGEGAEFPSGLGALRATIGAAALAPCPGEDPRERDAAMAAAQAAQIAAAGAWARPPETERMLGRLARPSRAEPPAVTREDRLPLGPTRRHLGPAARPMDPGPAGVGAGAGE
jgi:hypothetical protein